MPERIVPKQVRHDFTQAEKARLGVEMAEIELTISEKKDELDTFKAQIKSDTTALEARLNSIAHKLRSGFEIRTVDCRMEMDFESNSIRFVRTDTGDLLEERAMSLEERQRELDLEEEGETGPMGAEVG